MKDKIPDLIRESGKTPDTSQVFGDLYKHMLARKLSEELEEFMQDPSLEEAGDILEVVKSLFDIHDLKFADVSKAAAKKRSERGSFHQGIVLHGVL